MKNERESYMMDKFFTNDIKILTIDQLSYYQNSPLVSVYTFN